VPDHPLWYQRIPKILQDLETSQVPFLDRFSLENLFGVSRRQAIRLMASLGGYQVGRTFLVDREQLLTRLRSLALHDAVEHAVARKQRVWRQIEADRANVRARMVHIVPPPRQAARLPDLPPGIQVQPGRLIIDFGAPVDLLEKLFALSQAMTQDYGAFERLCRRA